METTTFGKQNVVLGPHLTAKCGPHGPHLASPQRDLFWPLPVPVLAAISGPLGLLMAAKTGPRGPLLSTKTGPGDQLWQPKVVCRGGIRLGQLFA